MGVDLPCVAELHADASDDASSDSDVAVSADATSGKAEGVATMAGALPKDGANTAAYDSTQTPQLYEDMPATEIQPAIDWAVFAHNLLNTARLQSTREGAALQLVGAWLKEGGDLARIAGFRSLIAERDTELRRVEREKINEVNLSPAALAAIQALFQSYSEGFQRMTAQVHTLGEKVTTVDGKVGGPHGDHET